MSLVLEYEEAALKATSVEPETLANILGYLCGEAHRQKIFFLWRPYLPDPRDDLVLELAVASKASRIVTYNRRHFAGLERFNIEAVGPREFLAEIGERKWLT